MNKAAVTIGVNRVDGLTTLRAAVSGADDVADWLEGNGYSVTRVNDRTEPVRRRGIFEIVEKLVQPSNLDRLVIYFAGHGFLKGPGEEVWALSGATSDPSEAVNLTQSRFGANGSGIPEVIFISDACRSLAENLAQNSITGGTIFPVGRRSQVHTFVDFFYAAEPGSTALELGADQAEEAHGLFTRGLLESHRGAPEEGLLQVGGVDHVRTRWLQETLPDRVDEMAQGINLELTQRPRLDLETANGVVARNEAGERSQKGGTSFEGIVPGPIPEGAVGRWTPAAPGRAHAAAASRRPVPRKRVADRELARRRDALLHFDSRETAVGLESAHATASIVVTGGPVELRLSRGEVRPVGLSGGLAFALDFAGPAASFLLRFADGSGVLLPALRDYSCELVLQGEELVALSYTWTVWRDPRLAKLRAEVLAKASMGAFQLAPAELEEFADSIRMSKKIDPSLGLVAALAYTLAGRRDGAESVRRYMRRDLKVDLFDVHLLGRPQDAERPVFPPCPMLSRTWSFLDLLPNEVPQILRTAVRLPNLWTVFHPRSMDDIADWFSSSQ